MHEGLEKCRTSNTRQVHTYCIWGGDGHTKMAQAHTHTPLSRERNRGRLCENEDNTLQKCGKQIGGHNENYGNETAQAKSDGQNMELSNTNQGHTKIATPISKDAGDSGTSVR